MEIRYQGAHKFKFKTALTKPPTLQWTTLVQAACSVVLCSASWWHLSTVSLLKRKGDPGQPGQHAVLENVLWLSLSWHTKIHNSCLPIFGLLFELVAASFWVQVRVNTWISYFIMFKGSVGFKINFQISVFSLL